MWSTKRFATSECSKMHGSTWMVPTCSLSIPVPVLGRRLYRPWITSGASAISLSASSSTKNLTCGQPGTGDGQLAE